MVPTFDTLRGLLRLSANDPRVAALTALPAEALERYQHVAVLALPRLGLSLNFKEAPWVVSGNGGFAPNELLVRGIHFHSAGYEGHEEFRGAFPGGVRFGDTEDKVIEKLGLPLATGGGGYSQILNKRIPRWLRYAQPDDAFFQLQLNEKKAVNLVTVFAPDLQSPA